MVGLIRRGLVVSMLLLGGGILPPTAGIANEGSYGLVAETSVRSPNVPEGIPWDLAYNGGGELIVVSEPDLQSKSHHVFTLGREGDLAVDWQATPLESSWRPVAVAVDASRERVYLSYGYGTEDPVRVYSADHTQTGSLQVRPASKAPLPDRLAVGPDGTVFGSDSLGFTTPGKALYRWSSDGSYRGAWNDDPEHPRYVDYYDLAVDEEGRVVLATVFGDGKATRLRRFSPAGASLGELELPHPPSIGPVQWSRDYVLIDALAAHHASSSFLVFTSLATDAEHVLRFSSAGAFLRAKALWPLQTDSHLLHRTITARLDGGYAASWQPHSRVDAARSASWAVTQFGPGGEIEAVTPVTGWRAAWAEVWPRARIAQGDAIRILYPQSAVVAELDELGEITGRRQAPPYGMDIAAASSGDTAVRGWDGYHGRLTLRNADGSTRWSGDCSCPLATGLAVDDDFVYASDPLRRMLFAYRTADGTAAGTLKPSQASAGWPLDIGALGGGEVATIGYDGRIEAWKWPPSGDGALRTWKTRSGVRPVAMSGSRGLLAVLLSDGGLEVWRGDGTLVDRWAARDPADRDLVDIALDREGRVTVLDASGPALLTYEPEAGTPPRSSPEPVPGSGVCALQLDKAAAPSRVMLGESVAVTLAMSGSCPPSPTEADVVLVWDPNSTFWYEYEFARARELMLQLIQALDGPEYRVAAVAVKPGTTEAEVIVPFDMERTAATAAVDSIVRYDRVARTNGELQWPDMAATANEYLRSSGRPDALQVVVLVGDGMPDVNLASTLDARQRGVVVLAIEAPWLREQQWAPFLESPDDLFFGAHASDVGRLTSAIEARLRQGRIRDVMVEDRLYSLVRYQAGSAAPIPSGTSSPDRLVWELEDLSQTPRTLRYRVLPLQTGRYPTNEQAVLYYTDADGSRRSLAFPQPIIEVVGPTATPTQIPTSTPTPTQPPTITPSQTLTTEATPAPRPLFLPLVLRERCVVGQQRMDVALVIDASTSMREPTREGRPKVEAATAAARAFLDHLGLPIDQAAIVTFNSDAALLQELTGRRSELEASLDDIQLARQTRIDRGVELAHQELTSVRRRRDNQPVMIILSDGKANPLGPEAAVEKARAAKDDKITVFTIGVGLGDDLDLSALERMASKPEYFHLAPDAEDLRMIYTEIAVTIPCPAEDFWGGR